MKIAFDNALPDTEQLDRLLRISGQEHRWHAEAKLSMDGEDCRYVAAYDYGQLVGIGRLASNRVQAEGERGDFDIVVLPHYRNRDIVGTIFRLLHARKYNPNKRLG